MRNERIKPYLQTFLREMVYLKGKSDTVVFEEVQIVDVPSYGRFIGRNEDHA